MTICGLCNEEFKGSYEDHLKVCPAEFYEIVDADDDEWIDDDYIDLDNLIDETKLN
jgi:hypothetical protein